ncbi:MAG: protoheme IX farnesyltransferase [Candidatus Heimdallarchaeota archaeon]|nr:protoheme IX farnesyltransferase [Candidatus Heimdallarchaeota archaeon]
MNKYIQLTKPRIILLLTITGIVAYLIPSIENIDFIDVIVFVLIGYCSAGGAMTINNIIDRDIDSLMERTKNRPTIGPDALAVQKVFLFGSFLILLSLATSWFYFGIFTLIHISWGVFSYLLGYSLYLKRKSVLNTLLGGLASPAPVWAGYAARYEMLNQIGAQIDTQMFLGVPIEGWLLGGLVFVWTPSHTWALSAKNMDDYARAGIPMLPVKLGMEKTALITMIFGIISMIYGNVVSYIFISNYIVMLALVIPNLLFLYGLIIFYRKPNVATATTSFKTHNIWLGIVFTIILIFIWTK